MACQTLATCTTAKSTCQIKMLISCMANSRPRAAAARMGCGISIRAAWHGRNSLPICLVRVVMNQRVGQTEGPSTRWWNRTNIAAITWLLARDLKLIPPQDYEARAQRVTGLKMHADRALSKADRCQLPSSRFQNFNIPWLYLESHLRHKVLIRLNSGRQYRHFVRALETPGGSGAAGCGRGPDGGGIGRSPRHESVTLTESHSSAGTFPRPAS